VIYYFPNITSIMMPRDDPGETNCPCLRMGCHTGVEHRAYVDGIYSPVQDFIDPIAFASRRACYSCDNGAILVES
jgi:hypothetical protein